MNGRVAFGGRLAARHISPPGPGLWWKLQNMRYLAWPCVQRIVRRIFGLSGMEGNLYARLFRHDGTVVDYGLVAMQMITTAFVNFMVDQLQTETSEWGDFKYHDSGVGTTDPAITDTDIETTDGESRATGNQGEGASANIYKSIGTISYTTSKAITEHGLFNSAATVTLMDRSEFAAINVVNGDSIQFTYELTCTAGG